MVLLTCGRDNVLLLLKRRANTQAHTVFENCLPFTCGAYVCALFSGACTQQSVRTDTGAWLFSGQRRIKWTVQLQIGISLISALDLLRSD